MNKMDFWRGVNGCVVVGVVVGVCVARRWMLR